MIQLPGSRAMLLFLHPTELLLLQDQAMPAITGTWSTGTDDSQVKLVLAFSTPAQFADISDDWHVTERTDTKITLQDVSGGNGGTDYLTFEKN